MKLKLGENNHPRAFVRVFVRGLWINYTVHVARLKTAESGALRRFPDAEQIRVSRERIAA